MIKYQAKVNTRSLNSYVEDILSREINTKNNFPKLRLPDRIDPELEKLCGILKECAESAFCDYFLTRNPKDYPNCAIPVLSPKEFLNFCKE